MVRPTPVSPPSPPRTLFWADVAPASTLHAALFAAPPNRPLRVSVHTHADFAEVFLVLGGDGTHQLNGAAVPLAAGDMAFVRTADIHALSCRAGGALSWVNVAFPLAAWRAWARFADASDGHREMARLRGAAFDAARGAFEDALRGFVSAGTGSRLDLARFLAGVLPSFDGTDAGTNAAGGDLPADAPAWLRAATQPFLGASDDALRAGITLLRARAGVSPTHLCRALVAATGATPTQWVNGRRLARAAYLLGATLLPVAEIGAACGFAELGYFYRLFRTRYGMPPARYRAAARGRVAP